MIEFSNCDRKNLKKKTEIFCVFDGREGVGLEGREREREREREIERETERERERERKSNRNAKKVMRDRN